MSKNLWLEILLSITTFASLIGIIVGGRFFKKLDKCSKYVFFYLIAAFITDLISRILHITFFNTLILVPVFAFVELLIFSILYNQLAFKNNRFFKPIIGFLLILIFIDIITCDASKFERFQSYGRVLDGFSIIFFSLYFYWKMLNNGTYENNRILKLNAGVFLFFLLNSFWFLIANFLVNTPYNVIFTIWLINMITTPLFYTFLTFHLWQNGKTLKQ